MHQFVVEFKSLSSHDKLDVIKIKAGDIVISHRFSRVGESCQLTGSNPVQTCLRNLVRQCLCQYRCRWNFARLYSVIWTFDLRRRRIVNVTQGHSIFCAKFGGLFDLLWSHRTALVPISESVKLGLWNSIKQGAPWSWKVIEFRKTIFQAWKVWKIAKVMENDDNFMEFLLLQWAIL